MSSLLSDILGFTKSKFNKNASQNNDSEDRTALNLTSEEALEELKHGNLRYMSNQSEQLGENAIKRQHTAIHGQFPIATVLACSDARMPVETLLDQGNGDVFVIRVAGNIVGDQVLGSIDYSLLGLNVPLILVLGHTNCGAIYSTVDAVYANKRFSRNLQDLLRPLIPLTLSTCQQFPEPNPEELLEIKEKLIVENVWKEVGEIIRASEEVKQRLRDKTLMVVGAVYDIKTGKVTWLGSHDNQEQFINEQYYI